MIRHSISPQSGTVGDIFTYQMTASQVDKLPVLATENKGDFQILSRRVEAKGKGGGHDFILTYQVAIYKVGEAVFPTQTVQIQENGQTRTVFLPALPVSIHSVVTQDLKTAALKDIAAPLRLSISWKPYVLSGLAFILCGILGYLAYKKWKKKYEKKALIQPDFKTPSEKALEALQTLKEKEYLGQGLIKLHYLALTEIMKHYFSELFDMSLADMTTDEVVTFLSHKLDEQTLRRVKNLLQSSDLAKFANDQLTLQEHQDNWERALESIKRTTPAGGSL